MAHTVDSNNLLDAATLGGAYDGVKLLCRSTGLRGLLQWAVDLQPQQSWLFMLKADVVDVVTCSQKIVVCICRRKDSRWSGIIYTFTVVDLRL